MIRKTTMVWISVFLRERSLEFQAYCGILVLAISLGLQMYFTPFKETHIGWNPKFGYTTDDNEMHPVLDQMESMALLINFMTLYLGLGFYSETLTPVLQLVLTAVLIASNIAFLVIALLIYVHQLHRECRLFIFTGFFKRINDWRYNRHHSHLRGQEKHRRQFYRKRRESIKRSSIAVSPTVIKELHEQLGVVPSGEPGALPK